MISREAQGWRQGELNSSGLHQLLQPRFGVEIRKGGRYKIAFLVDKIDEEWNRRSQAEPEEVNGSSGSHLIDFKVNGLLF